MSGPTQKTSIRLVVMALVIGSSIAAVSPATAQTPEDANDFLSEFRELQGSPAFEEYNEFEVVRSQAVVAVQAGEFDDTERRQMRLVLQALRSFNTAYRLSQNGSVVESVRRANETGQALNQLSAGGGEKYSALAGLALDRFYETQGDRIFEMARNTDQTRQRLALMREAGTAYSRAGASDRFSELTVRTSRLETEFGSDLERINESAAGSRRFLDGCSATCDSAISAALLGPNVFERYRTAMGADSAAHRSLELAREHRIERTAELEELAASTRSSLVSLAIGSLLVALAYGALIALIAGFITLRVVAWQQDFLAARVDAVVLGQGWDDV